MIILPASNLQIKLYFSGTLVSE